MDPGRARGLMLMTTSSGNEDRGQQAGWTALVLLGLREHLPRGQGQAYVSSAVRMVSLGQQSSTQGL